MTIQIKVTDEEMKLLQDAAEKQGLSVEQAAQISLQDWLTRERQSQAKIQRGEGNFASCFGIFNGEVGSLSNEDIDRDLAREYGDTHEPKK